MDLLIGAAGAVLIRLIVYFKGKNAKEVPERHGIRFCPLGDSRGYKALSDPVFENNIILTQTERLTMNSRPKQPKYARNKNILSSGEAAAERPGFRKAEPYANAQQLSP